MSTQRLLRPDFIIIGAMKCATSTLHEQLARQPNIFMSTPKEPCFFSDDDVWDRGVEWYQSLYAEAEAADVCGESSTHYTKLPTHPEAVSRMKELLPDHTRFIYVIRHPIDRLVSQYIHEWSQRIVNCPIDEAVDQFTPLIDYSRYAMQVEPYIGQFGADRVLPVFFERLVRRPQEQLERVARFIGYNRPVQWSTESDRENVSGERVRKSPLRSFAAAVPGLRPLLHAMLSESVRDRIKSRWRMPGRPVLSAQVRERLESILDEDLSQLTPWLLQHGEYASTLPMSCETFEQMACGEYHGNAIREAVS